jgi:hypothetical protein
LDFHSRLRLSVKRNTVQNLAEQRELPGECPQENTHSPDGLRRFRYLNRRSLNGIAVKRDQNWPDVRTNYVEEFLHESLRSADEP